MSQKYSQKVRKDDKEKTVNMKGKSESKKQVLGVSIISFLSLIYQAISFTFMFKDNLG